MFLSVDPLLEQTMTPYQYTYQNPIRYIDPTGMSAEDGGGDPDDKRITDFYESKPNNSGGRTLTKTHSSMGTTKSGYNESFVNVVDDKGFNIDTFTGSNAVSSYMSKYGTPSDVNIKISDDLSGFERTMYAVGEVTYIALTDPVTSTIIFAPLEAVVAAKTLKDLNNISKATRAYKIGETGKMGEQILKGLGGQSQVRYTTSTGARVIDQLVGKVAHESKVGYTSLTRDIQKQIAKDVELINAGKINSSTWHFFKSPVTGQGGASKPLLQELTSKGINYIIH
ncbi:hypothetical protein [Apibacter muscae]|uniref:hypothetical protein n=1 Tax=Apibacter muscae TaxID=2509004 RepID=UPI0035D48F24